MKTIPLSDVVVGDRQRKEFKQPAIDQLKRSIMSKGLLHPPVLTTEYHLLAGERRLRAMTQLYEEGLTFTCDGLNVPQGEIPYLFISDLSPADMQEAELEENILREPLSMMEEVEAKAKIHQLRCEQNPKQAVVDTAREISAITGTSESSERHAIAESLIIVQHKDNPRVQRAKTRKEAIKAVLDEQEVRWQAQITKKTLVGEQEHRIIHGDCTLELPRIPSNSVSLILSDPPYGIKADKQGKESNHYYDDSPESSIPICETIIREGFRICKQRAILFMFCDIDHFTYLRGYASQQAWTPFRTPLTWYKGNSGHAPWGRAGFRRTTEIILFAVKGQDELNEFGGDDLLNFSRVSRGERVHAAEKPHELLCHLINLGSLPGELVLDPCAGSGPVISAARKLARRSITIERDETSYSECLARLQAPIPPADAQVDGSKTASEILAELE
jgi:site-specific DNA-methyltransferase (adenine-specific)